MPTKAALVSKRWRAAHPPVSLACSTPGCTNPTRSDRPKPRQGSSGLCRPCSKRGEPFRHVYTRLKANARQRGLPVSLTYADFLNFTSVTRCHYCEALIEWQPFYTKQGEPGHQKYFLDRKDNAKGYAKDNLVVCCTLCNMVRGAKFTYKEFLLLAPALNLIRQHRESAP